MAANESEKTALELALELGIRSDTVVEGLRKMGLDAQDATDTIDTDTESMLVSQLADEGAISSKLAKGKGRRKPSEDPYVDDDLLTQALGASATGFQESQIPRQITLESGFEKQPNFFQRLFGKTKNLANNLKKNPLSDEDLNSLFQSRVQRQDQLGRSPFQEIDQDVHSQPPLEETSEEELEESSSTAPEEKLDEEMDLEDLELDEDLMEDLDSEGSEDLEELDSEDLADLEDLDIDDLEEPAEEDSSEMDEELEDFEDELGEEESEEGEAEGTEEEEEEEQSDEEEEPQGRIERWLSRIQLSPAEMWTLMGGSIITMLLLLGITIYWWLNISPKAQESLWQKAMNHYDTAQSHQEAGDWSQARSSYQDAIELLERIPEQFPDHPHIKEAYKYLSDAYYEVAQGIENHESLDAAHEPYRQTIQWTEDYLKLLENLAMQQARENQNLPPEERKVSESYVNPDEQREGLRRIAEAHRKLNEYDAAIDLLGKIADRYSGSNYAYQAMVDIGDTYRARAEVDTERKREYLNEAVNAYKNALQNPDVNHSNKMKLYQGLGDTEHVLYQDNVKNNRDEDAKSHLIESIGYYEKARDEAKQISISRDDPQYTAISKQVKNIYKNLADLYLVRGEEAGENWDKFERQATAFPKGMPPKKQLEDEAQRQEEIAREFLQKATDLYDDILDSEEVIEPDLYHDILYNKALSYHILRDYPTTIAAGKQIIDSTMSPNEEIETKTYYLLGDAAWKQAKSNNSEDYSLVKKYYLEALDLNPFYPRDQKGETSNLAEIRLTNIYFQNEKDYEQAIQRYEIAEGNYTDTAYTYLTMYYYANALEEYGDELMDQARQKEAEAEEIGGAVTLEEEAQQLRQQAKDLYQQAVNKYSRAIETRDDSRYGDPINKTYLIEIMFDRGHSAYKAGDYDQAIQYLNRALDEYEDDPVAQQYIPKALERLGDANIRIANYDQAIRYYNRYLDRSYEDKDARVSMKLGDAYLRELSYPQARKIYRKIVKDYPLPSENEVQRRLRINLPVEKGPGFEALKKIAESYYKEVGGIADLEKREEKLQQAMEAYQTLVDHFPLDSDYPELPNDADSLRMVGNIHWELENFQNAAESYQQFLSVADDYPRRGFILWRIGNCYMYKPDRTIQDIDEAIDALSNITQESMDTPQSYADSLLLLGRAYEAKAMALLQEDENNNAELYEVNMERAAQTYEQAMNANAPNKVQVARNRRQEVLQDIQNHRKLATAP